MQRIEAEEIERQGPETLLSNVDGILIPGGFGKRGIEGKIATTRFAREAEIPYFGICLGMQCSVIEFARNVLNLPDAHSTEFNSETSAPVICLLEEQKEVTEKGGTMRLGAQDCIIKPESNAHTCYGADSIIERHRHRYEFNPEYRKQMIEAGMIPTGTSPNGNLVEIVEIPDHPWYLAVQFHPEFKSKPVSPHPLFAGFVGAALNYHQQKVRVTV